jgi:hypothetical protein
MKITPDGNGGFRLVNFPYGVGLVAFPIALFLLYKFTTFLGHESDLQQTYGALMGAGIALVVGAAFTQRTVFTFDAVRRQITWSKRGWYGSFGGTIPFNEICSVGIDQHSSADGGPSYRVLISSGSQNIPIPDAYSSGEISRRRCQDLCDLINRTLGHT